MERYLGLEKTFLKRHYYPHLLITLLVCLLSGGIMSFRSLTQAQAAQVMEMYVAVTGIVLLTPLFMPEQDRDIWRLEQSRVLPMWKLYLLRIVTALAVLAAVVTVFVGILAGSSEGLALWPLWLGGFCEAVFLGSMGYFVSALTNQSVLGYMISILYYAVNVGASDRLGVMGLFQMMREKEGFIIPMLAASCVLLSLGTWLRERIGRNL